MLEPNATSSSSEQDNDDNGEPQKEQNRLRDAGKTW